MEFVLSPRATRAPEDQFFVSLYCGDFRWGIQAYAHKNACIPGDCSWMQAWILSDGL